MSGASHTLRPRAIWKSSHSRASARPRRRLGVTTVDCAAAPAARRAKTSGLASMRIASLARLRAMKTVVALVFFFVSTLAAAQDYPAREIRSICNFAAGSGADIVVRYYSDALSRLLANPVVVENKPGAQGLLASDFVAKSKPDGYTLMITPASSTLASAPHLFKKLPFDPLKDFAAVTSVASLSFVLAADAAKPIRSIEDLVKVLKSKPNHGFY